MQLKSLAIVSILAAAATSCGGDNSSCTNAKQEDKEIGVQLYSVRKPIDEQIKNGGSIASVLDSLASWGYTWVEAANYNYNDGTFYGMTPADYKAAVEAAGLKSRSSHTTLGLSDEEMKSGNFAEKLAQWDKLIADHKAAGIDYTPYGPAVSDISPEQPRERTVWVRLYVDTLPSVPKYSGEGESVSNAYCGFTYTGDIDDLLEKYDAGPDIVIPETDGFF